MELIKRQPTYQATSSNQPSTSTSFTTKFFHPASSIDLSFISKKEAPTTSAHLFMPQPVSRSGKFFLTDEAKKLIEHEVKQLIDKKMDEICLKSFHCYIGFTSRLSFRDRFAEHSRLHEKVDGEVLTKYRNLADVCFAEYVGIKYVRTLVQAKNVLSCWNKTSGYDVGTHSAYDQSQVFNLYMLWGENINDRDKTIGRMNRARSEANREPGKFWSLNESQNLTFSSNVIEHHFYTLGRVNVECSKCQMKFRSSSAKNHHMESTHNALETEMDCKLCGYIGSIHEVRKHIQVKLPLKI